MRAVITFGVVLMLGFVTWGCSTLQVESDYNPSYDFSSLKSFAIVFPSDGSITLVQQRFAKAIASELESKGYRQVDRTKADFIVVFHLNVTRKTQVVTDYERVGIYPYHYRGRYYFHGGAMVPVERQFSYKEGQIVVDAVSPAKKEIFWRSMATDRLQSFKSQEEKLEYISKVVKEVFMSFPARGGQER